MIKACYVSVSWSAWLGWEHGLLCRVLEALHVAVCLRCIELCLVHMQAPLWACRLFRFDIACFPRGVCWSGRCLCFCLASYRLSVGMHSCTPCVPRTHCALLQLPRYLWESRRSLFTHPLLLIKRKTQYWMNPSCHMSYSITNFLRAEGEIVLYTA